MSRGLSFRIVYVLEEETYLIVFRFRTELCYAFVYTINNVSINHFNCIFSYNNCVQFKALAVVTVNKSLVWQVALFCSELSTKHAAENKIIFLSPPPLPPHVPYGLTGRPSRLWPKCNRLLKLGHP
jgi:hypothetical protein